MVRELCNFFQPPADHGRASLRERRHATSSVRAEWKWAVAARRGEMIGRGRIA